MNILNRLGEMGTVLDLSENNLWSNSAKQNKKKIKMFSALQLRHCLLQNEMLQF